MDYYYTSSLKYTSPVSMESNSSLRFKYDEASGTWLECHKWTKEGRTDTVEKIVCSADGNDYLLSQKNSSTTKKIGISEFEIGGVEVPAETP